MREALQKAKEFIEELKVQQTSTDAMLQINKCAKVLDDINAALALKNEYFISGYTLVHSNVSDSFVKCYFEVVTEISVFSLESLSKSLEKCGISKNCEIACILKL